MPPPLPSPLTQPKTPIALRQDIADQLKMVGIENSFDEAKWLILAALNTNPGLFVTSGDTPLKPQALQTIQNSLQRRLQREPLSRISGTKEFWSLPFRLNEHTLDPRPDSEILVKMALEYLPTDTPQSLLDLGTGTGCLLISLLHERPLCNGIGVDLSPQATQQATANAVLNRVSPRAHFITTSWGKGLMDQSFDLIISNPPYIPREDEATLAPEVKDFDPSLALYGGLDGLACYRTLAPEVKRLLKPTGICVLEIGWDQADRVGDIFEKQGFVCLNTGHDLGGRDRCLIFGTRVSERS